MTEETKQPEKTIQSADDEIELLIRSNQPIISIVTYEEDRVLEHIKKVRSRVVELELEDLRNKGSKEEDINAWRQFMRPLVHWSCTAGFNDFKKDEEKNPLDSLPSGNYKDVEVALSDVMRPLIVDQSGKSKGEYGGIYVFRDLHPYIDPTYSNTYSSKVIRRLRDIAKDFRLRKKRTLMLLSPIRVIPPELEKDMAVVEYPLPGKEDLREKLEEIRRENPGMQIKLEDAQVEELLQKSVGLTLSEVRSVWIKSIAQKNELNEDVLGQVNEEKKQIIKKSGLLEYFPVDETFNDVGGLKKLKKWIEVRRIAFTGVQTAGDGQRFVLPTLKGVLLVGIPGCGKSLAAKAIASKLQVPLVRLDAGRLYQSYLGSTEANLRRAISVVEGLAPVVLWVDEVEKAFPKTSGAGDSGTSARVLGTLLNWMQEKTCQVFVVATANDVEVMPPELTRKGRFDEIFLVGLPNLEETGEILAIHLRKLKFLKETALPGDKAMIDGLAKIAYNRHLTGAEIEMAVKNALWVRINETVSASVPETEAVLRSEIESIKPIVHRLKENEAYKKMQQTFDRIAIPASEEGIQEIPEAPAVGGSYVASVSAATAPISPLNDAPPAP
jgi:ATP-dependent 26S proteasome regulatory subunit/uncharacterized protein (DUF2147 family)